MGAAVGVRAAVAVVLVVVVDEVAGGDGEEEGKTLGGCG